MAIHGARLFTVVYEIICDTVSAFSGKGKLGALGLMKGQFEFKKALADTGNEWTPNENLLSVM